MAKNDKIDTDTLLEGTPQELHYIMGKLGMTEEQEQFEKEIIALQSGESGKERDVLAQYDKIRKKGAFISGIGALAGAIVAGALGFFAGRKKEDWGKFKRNSLTIGSGIGGATAMNAVTSIPMRKQLASIRKQVIEEQGAQAEVLMKIMDKYAHLVDERMNAAGAGMAAANMEKIPEATVVGDSAAKNAPPEAATKQALPIETIPASKLTEASAAQAMPLQQSKNV